MAKEKGILTATGTIDIAQFWPNGISDADTVKILVRVSGPSSFKFRSRPGAVAIETNAFKGAFMKGSDSVDKKTGKKRKPKMVINSKSQITVRLQGIDAPELHFKPQLKLNLKEGPAVPGKFVSLRQHFGESATVALANFLKTFGSSPLPCQVVTRVDHPNDVFDKYGRFVGDILIKKGNQEININHWLVEQGWAFPAFYDSMTEQEIRDLIGRAEAARKAGRDIWRKIGFTNALGKLDLTLKTRPKKSALAPDAGAVIIPKFFRRQYTWVVDVARGGSTAKDLKQYLLGAKKPDTFYDTAAFLKSLAQNLKKPNEIKLGNAIDTKNRLTVMPKDFVFLELPGVKTPPQVLVRGPKSTPVTSW